MTTIFDKIKIAEQSCKGLIFRGYNSQFFDYKNKRIEKKEGLKLLKRKSCKGCSYCGFYFDDMYDMLEMDGIIFPEKIENNKLYGIKIVNEQTDWETGIVDQWDYEFYLLKENE